jgi:hypothetical protein
MAQHSFVDSWLQQVLAMRISFTIAELSPEVPTKVLVPQIAATSKARLTRFFLPMLLMIAP